MFEEYFNLADRHGNMLNAALPISLAMKAIPTLESQQPLYIFVARVYTCVMMISGQSS